MNAAINIMLGATVLIGAAALMAGPLEERRKAKVEQKFDIIAAHMEEREPMKVGMRRSSSPVSKPSTQPNASFKLTRLEDVYRHCARRALQVNANPRLQSAVEGVMEDMLEETLFVHIELGSRSGPQLVRTTDKAYKAARSRAKSRISEIGKTLDERSMARFYTRNIDAIATDASRCSMEYADP